MLHSECPMLAINQYRRSIHIGIGGEKPTKIPTVIALYYNTSRGPREPDETRDRAGFEAVVKPLLAEGP